MENREIIQDKRRRLDHNLTNEVKKRVELRNIGILGQFKKMQTEFTSLADQDLIIQQHVNNTVLNLTRSLQECLAIVDERIDPLMGKDSDLQQEESYKTEIESLQDSLDILLMARELDQFSLNAAS